MAEARSIGLVGAIEIVADKASRQRFPEDMDVGSICRDYCFANGLVMCAVGDTMIVSPPLIVEHSHIDEMVEKVWLCLDLTADFLGVER